MDFPTRNLYRSAIEELARGSNRTELDVAHSAVLAAEQAATRATPAWSEAAAGSRLSSARRRTPCVRSGDRLPARRCARGSGAWAGPVGIGGYVGAVAVVAAVLLAVPLVAVAATGSAA